MKHLCPACQSEYECSAGQYCYRPTETQCEVLLCASSSDEPFHRKTGHIYHTHRCALHGEYRCLEDPCILPNVNSANCPDCAHEQALFEDRRVKWDDPKSRQRFLAGMESLRTKPIELEPERACR